MQCVHNALHCIICICFGRCMDGLALCAPVACGLWPVACGAWRLCLLVAEWLWLWIAAIADVTAACCYCCCYWPESGCAVLLLLLLLLLLLADDLLLAPVLHETPPCTCTPHVHRARAAARRYGAGCWQLLGALCLSPPPLPALPGPDWPSPFTPHAPLCSPCFALGSLLSSIALPPPPAASHLSLEVDTASVLPAAAAERERLGRSWEQLGVGRWRWASWERESSSWVLGGNQRSAALTAGSGSGAFQPRC
jgi:hypothetical protein